VLRPPSDARLPQLIVAMIAGARIVGQTQNEGGALAVVLLKRALIDEFGSEPWLFSDRMPGDAGPAEEALQSARWVYRPTDAIVDFTGGPNRPDVLITLQGRPTLVGEVKGRKDLSNVWESWMPQLVDHLRTWAGSYPTALRGAFMTLITEEM